MSNCSFSLSNYANSSPQRSQYTIIEKMIEELLRPLDEATIKSLWLETEVGMCKEDEVDCYLTDSLRSDLEVELL